MVGGFIVALLVALFITAIAVLIFKRTGPWGTAWTFFLILFLGLWAVSIYVRSVGPVYWGIAWLPLLFSAVIFAFLLVSIVPDANHWRDESLTDSRTSKTGQVEELSDVARPRRGSLFWFIIVILVIVIVVGMVNPQMAL